MWLPSYSYHNELGRQGNFPSLRWREEVHHGSGAPHLSVANHEGARHPARAPVRGSTEGAPMAAAITVRAGRRAGRARTG